MTQSERNSLHRQLEHALNNYQVQHQPQETQYQNPIGTNQQVGFEQNHQALLFQQYQRQQSLSLPDSQLQFSLSGNSHLKK